MVKVVGPLLSMKATGTIGGITFANSNSGYRAMIYKPRKKLVVTEVIPQRGAMVLMGILQKPITLDIVGTRQDDPMPIKDYINSVKSLKNVWTSELFHCFLPLGFVSIDVHRSLFLADRRRLRPFYKSFNRDSFRGLFVSGRYGPGFGFHYSDDFLMYMFLSSMVCVGYLNFDLNDPASLRWNFPT